MYIYVITSTCFKLLSSLCHNSCVLPVLLCYCNPMHWIRELAEKRILAIYTMLCNEASLCLDT